MKHTAHHNRQAGVVSILTVLMFSILVGVLLTGFARMMVQEQQDTLNDDLSKSAYNAAQAGVEDAKRALRYCAANPTSAIPGRDCSNLYRSTCPGFNTGGAFRNLLGYQPGSSGTTVGDPAANQRYTCVIISPSTNIETELSSPDTTGNTALYKLTGQSAFDTVEVRWDQGATALGTTGSEGLRGTGNVRISDWNAAYPAVLRVSLLSANDALTDLTQKDTFLYPVSNGTTTNPGYLSIPPRVNVHCTVGNTYTCQQTFAVAGMQNNRFIKLQSFYKGTKVSITLRNGGTVVPLAGNEQVTVDSTGAAANVFRRVQSRLSPGSAIATGSAIDVGNSLCKDFFVGADRYDNTACHQ